MLLAAFCGSGRTYAQALPQGFTAVQVTAGLSRPTALAFAPDGRIFIAQQSGAVRIVKNGTLLAAPFVTLSVQSTGERGLIGLALDPSFSSNGLVYLYHTLPDGSRNRISRVTANGDVAVAGSEQLVLNLDALSSATNHNGGAMHFGPDGKLYVAIGDNASPANAQNMDTYHGKLLRVNANGTVPAGNPFSGSAQKSRIWAYGLRNPFTFDFQPGTGKLFVNDVGQDAWEEINDATAGGKNFGWPAAEGYSADSDFANPVYVYPNGEGDGNGCAITGGVFFNPASTNYPAAYRGTFFFQDYCNGWISFLDMSGTTAASKPFATGIQSGSALYLTVGNDGNLYYLQRGSNSLHKIIYTENNAPVIVEQPVAVSVPQGQPAVFSVKATGGSPLSYQWRKNSTNIAGATAASYTIANVQPADAGTYSVVVTNGAGSATSRGAQLTVAAVNTPPDAQIATPASGALYRAGDTILFSGTATDAEDGSLAAGAFSWWVAFHHDAHKHDGPPVAQGTKTGSFVVPTSGETALNVWYRLMLVVKDSKGLTDTAYRDIHPHKSVMTFRTQPAGLQVTLDGQPLRTPLSVSGVEGIEREIGVLTLQTADIKVYDFDRWLHGGAATQTIRTPRPDSTFTAVYKESRFSSFRYEAETATRSGVKTATAHAGFTGSGYADYINASSDYVEWSFNAATAGSYNLGFRYALENGTRNLRVTVNGTTINTAFAFNATGSWGKWAYANLSAILKTGTNTVRLTATGTSGPNLDHLVVTPQLLEAEAARLSGAEFANTSAGFTGTGYVNYKNATGDFIEWIVYKNVAGPASLNFRYANGGTYDRPLVLRVNGTAVSEALYFPPTGGWAKWSVASATVTLNAGMNRIRLTANGKSGANLDHLAWKDAASASSQQTVAQSKNIASISKKALAVSVTPNPASGVVRLQVQKPSDGPVQIRLYNSAGKLLKTIFLAKEACCLDLPLAGYPSGLYMISAVQGHEKTTAWLVVQ